MNQFVRKAFLNQILSAFSALLVIATVSTANAAETCQRIFERTPEKATVRTYEASENVSQYVRDNAPDYWRWSKKYGSEYFGKLIKQEGLVIGDAHPGNFIYSPLAGKMKFFIMDIKDAGHGPFIVDIAHQIMATNVVLKRGDADIEQATKQQLEAYLAGLQDKNFETHKDINWIFETSKKNFDKEVKEYVDSKTAGSKFKFKDEMIEPLYKFVKNTSERNLLQSGMEASVKKHLKGAKVLHYAYRPRERGGSKNLKRYWALVEHKGERMILEFKEIEAPAVAQFTEQLPAIERFNLIMKTFWGVNDPTYQAVELAGKPFWMRPKKVDVFAVPYKQNDKDEQKFLRHLAAYEAYLMGQYHGKQLQNKKFSDDVEMQFDELTESINTMSNDYVDRLTEKVEELQKNEDYD